MMDSASSSISFSQSAMTFSMSFLVPLGRLSSAGNLLIPLEQLDGVPAGQVGSDLARALQQVLNVCDGVLHAALEHMRQLTGLMRPCAVLGGRLARRPRCPRPSGRRSPPPGSPAQRPASCMSILSPFLRTTSIMFSAMTTGMPQLSQLRGQVQVALDIGTRPRCSG